MEREWIDEAALAEELRRGRNTESSVQAQYEDSVLPEREWEHEEDS